MITVHQIAEVRTAVKQARTEGKLIGLVPTMGALHAGHLSLCQRARRECDFLVVSIFVNPTQFAPGEDYEKYPRTIDADQEQCRQAGVDLLFAPTPAEIYPTESLTTVHVEQLTESLCGPLRPGHFDGVTAIVAKLFNIVQSDFAYFGEKDAQQAIVLHRMTVDLNMPVKLKMCPTVRNDDGLALSSRNDYLSGDETQRALQIRQSLMQAQQAIQAGQTDSADIIRQMRETINQAKPTNIDYIDIVDPHTMTPVATIDSHILIAVAARIGPARLIDNILLDKKGRIINMDRLFE